MYNYSFLHTQHSQGGKEASSVTANVPVIADQINALTGLIQQTFLFLFLLSRGGILILLP